MVVEPPVLDRHERLDHMRGQVRHHHRLVGDRAIARDRRAVGGEQRDHRRRDRLERLVERRGDRQPGDQHDEQRQHGGDDPPRPPALAPLAPIGALPEPLAVARFALHTKGSAIVWSTRNPTIDLVEPRIPFVVIGFVAQPVVQRIIAPMRSRFGLWWLAPERIEQAHAAAVLTEQHREGQTRRPQFLPTTLSGRSSPKTRW